MLKDIKAISSTWNSKAVAYRLSYVTERIECLSKPPGMDVKLLSAGNEPRKALRLAEIRIDSK